MARLDRALDACAVDVDIAHDRTVLMFWRNGVFCHGWREGVAHPMHPWRVDRIGIHVPDYVRTAARPGRRPGR
jgi:hypothetical protein